MFSLRDELSSGDFDRCAGGTIGLGFQDQTGDRRDRRKRLAAEAKGLDREQVLRFVQFTRRMPAKTGSSVFRRHSFAIVGDANPFPAAFLHVNRDLSGAGIEGVLHQFFDDRCRALDDFTRSNAIGDVVGERSNFHTRI